MNQSFTHSFKIFAFIGDTPIYVNIEGKKLYYECCNPDPEQWNYKLSPTVQSTLSLFETGSAVFI